MLCNLSQEAHRRPQHPINSRAMPSAGLNNRAEPGSVVPLALLEFSWRVCGIGYVSQGFSGREKQKKFPSRMCNVFHNGQPHICIFAEVWLIFFGWYQARLNKHAEPGTVLRTASCFTSGGEDQRKWQQHIWSTLATTIMQS